MCGIAGLVRFRDECSERESSLVSRMVKVQHHRGPDDGGVEVVGKATLGSNRLSIIDLSAAGHMPMHDPESGRWIAFNGELYNFASLRSELSSLGHHFHSKTDTEVVLHAFREWGESALDRFVGMFAFAIYDPAADRLTLVRDRFGKKPVYYTQQSDQLIFASELKSLVSVCPGLDVNLQRLNEWSLYRNIDFGPQETMFQGVLSLPPGHFVTVDAGMVGEPKPFFQLHECVRKEEHDRLGRLSIPDLSRELETLMLEAVEDRLVSDVPVGTLCSGGIDSSLITSVAAKRRKDLLAFNVSVTGAGAFDESGYAKQVTDSLGIELLTLKADGQNFRENLVRAIYHSDYPLTHPNSVFFLLISEFAKSHGVKVLLSGEAADELFGGYAHRYRRYAQYRRIQQVVNRLPGKLRRIIAAAGYAVEDVPVMEFTGYEKLMAHSTSFVDRFSRAELRSACMETFSFIENEIDRGVLAGMLADLSNFLAPLLRRLDRMSMGASVECRVPFLDHRLVGTAVNLPLEYRLRGRSDKWMLKEIAGHHLPHEIVHRKKIGFPLPLRDYLQPFVSEEFFKDGFCTNQLGISAVGLKQLVDTWEGRVDGFFSMLALEIWGRLFFLEQSVEDVDLHLARTTAHRPANG